MIDIIMLTTKERKTLKISLVVDRSNEQWDDVTEIDIFEMLLTLRQQQKIVYITQWQRANMFHSFLRMIIFGNFS